jgi:hypothetical protein
MITPCESCPYGLQLVELGEGILSLVARLENGSEDMWGMATEMSLLEREAADAASPTPGEQADMDQSREYVTRAAARMMRLKSDAKSSFITGLYEVESVDCSIQPIGCPKVERALRVLEFDVMDLIAQLPANDPDL